MMIRFDDGSGDLPEQREIPTPLVTLLPVLGPQRMNQVQEMAYELCEREDFAAVELVCMAEMVRTYAETLVWRDERQGAPLRARSIPPWNPPAQSEEHSPIAPPAKLRSASQPTSPPRDRVPYVGETSPPRDRVP